jgi:hypothetical protein
VLPVGFRGFRGGLPALAEGMITWQG